MRRLPALAVALVLLAAPVALAEPVPGGVAVVDMLKLITAHGGYGKAREALEARKKRADEDMKAAEDGLKAKLREYELLGNKDTPQAREAERQIKFMETTAKFQYEWAGRVAQDEYARALVAIHRQVKDLVAAYARTNRIAIVLQMTDEELKAASREEFVSNLVVRGVVFYDASVDITKKVMELLPAAPSAPAAPAVAPPAAPAPAGQPPR